MIALFLLSPVFGQAGLQPSQKKRADLILLELGPRFSKKEMPGVMFRHDAHTKALANDCSACHSKDSRGGYVFNFKRTTEDPSMELYHQGCISCHDEKKATGKASGPLEAQCGSCHVKNNPEVSSARKPDFHKSLHFTHANTKAIKGLIKGEEGNCSACHHQYDETAKKIIPAKGQEESCAYCHKAVANKDVRSMRTAAHDACVKCHQDLTAKNIHAGPVDCAGCHDPVRFSTIEKRTDVPRLKRNQPDTVLLTRWLPERTDQKGLMPAVAFDHKQHEAATADCKTCHHATLKKCSECHDLAGKETKGGNVNLARAMHLAGSTRSCRGCHARSVQDKNCSGCHAQMPAASQNPESCQACHDVKTDSLGAADLKIVAAKAIQERKEQYQPVPADRIPETVAIGGLAREYEPSRFPHRKIFQAIAKRVGENQMGKSFHKDQSRLCMGCHHNTPVTLTPPRCASCHSTNGPGPDGRPGLKGAYHGQCITCHQQMNVAQVAATDCIKCHERKK